MNRAERHEALIRLHTAKLVHARLLGSHISTLLQPTRSTETISLGRFDSPDEASAAYQAAAKKLFTHL